MNKYKQLAWLLLVMIIGTAVVRGYYYITDDFRLGNITDNLPYLDKWDIPPLSREEREDLEKLFAQKFIYLGKGAQSYALASEDGKYVLKFFKFKHLRVNPLIQFLPPLTIFREYKLHHYKHTQDKLHKLFDGHHLAYTEDREYSGLVFIHLNQTHNYPLYTVIVDKLGMEHQLNLEPLFYVVQKKGKTLRSVLKELLDNGQVNEAQEKINLILSMYLDEYKRGLFDRDHGVLHNTGFIGDKPFHLDVGKLSKNAAMKEPVVFKSDLSKVISRMQPWLKQHYPQYIEQLMHGASKHVSAALGEKYEIFIQ